MLDRLNESANSLVTSVTRAHKAIVTEMKGSYTVFTSL